MGMESRILHWCLNNYNQKPKSMKWKQKTANFRKEELVHRRKKRKKKLRRSSWLRFYYTTIYIQCTVVELNKYERIQNKSKAQSFMSNRCSWYLTFEVDFRKKGHKVSLLTNELKNWYKKLQNLASTYFVTIFPIRVILWLKQLIAQSTIFF